MKRRAWLAPFALCMAACAQPTPEQQIVNDAAQALGGRDRILAAKTLVLEGQGTNGNLGQDMRPEATSQSFTVTDYKRAIDLASGRARIEQTRTPNFEYFQGPAPLKQVQGIDGDVGYNVAPTGTATRIPTPAADIRRLEVYHHPLTAVGAALDPATKVGNPRTQGDQSLVDLTTAKGATLTLAINSTTKLPTRVTSMTYNPNLGDVALETSFADYQDVNGLKLPARLTTKTDQVQTAELRVSKQALDAETGDLAAPPTAASAAAIAGPPAPNVAAEEVAKGIWLLAGQSHHSVLVEFSDHLTLIEAPQNEPRTLAVIAKARELRPDKPLTQVVATHHHFDHSGGIRAAVSEGLRVVAHRSSAAFYEEAVKRAHTITPDALAKTPKPVTLEPVDDELVMKDSAMTMHLYHIADNPHADTLLMAYFPNERLLVQADVFAPGAPVSPYAANFLENVKKRNLRVDRIVPIHGTIFPFNELVKTVQAMTSH